VSDAGVRLERRGAVALVTLDRPDRMNALSRAAVARFAVRWPRKKTCGW
jgi:enoyl-CoA hydratase/carnithine racemase